MPHHKTAKKTRTLKTLTLNVDISNPDPLGVLDQVEAWLKSNSVLSQDDVLVLISSDPGLPQQISVDGEILEAIDNVLVPVTGEKDG